MLRYCYVLLHLHTHAMLRYGNLGVGLGGVGWGNDVHVNLHTHVMLRYCYVLLHLHTHVMPRYGCIMESTQKNTLNWKSLSWVTVGKNLWDH